MEKLGLSFVPGLVIQLIFPHLHDGGDARDWRRARRADEHENASSEVSEEDNSEKPTEDIDTGKVINKTKENEAEEQ